VTSDPPPNEPLSFLGMARALLVEMLCPLAGVLIAVSLAVLGFAIAGL